MIVVDDRWVGRHGIGRYASEVIPRLGFEATPIEPGGRPSAPGDFVTKRISVGRRRPDHVYSPGYNGFLRRVGQTVTVLDLIHLQGPDAAKYRPYYALFLRPLIRRNRHVITISETSRAAIREWLDDPAVEIVNAGIGSSSAFTRTGPAWDEAVPYVLYVGNLKHHKNVRTLLAAMAQLPDLRLVMVVPDREPAARLADEFGLGVRTSIRTAVEDADLAALYRGAGATVSPSTIEGFGLPAQESALCGTPVVYWSGCATIAETLAGGGVPVEDAADAGLWANAIAQAVDGPRFQEGLVTADRYSWDSVAGMVTETVLRHV